MAKVIPSFLSIVFLLLSNSIYIHAQVIDKLNTQKYLSAGDNYMAMNDFTLAIESYNNALDYAPENTTIIAKLAYSYYLANDFESASECYSALIEDKIELNANKYFLANCYIRMARYDTAQIILKSLLISKISNSLKKKIKQDLAICSFALYSLTDPKNISITHLPTPVNDIRSEYSPLFINDSLVLYAQEQPVDEIKYSLHDTAVLPYTNIYYLHYKNKTWVKGAPLPPQVNKQNVHSLNGSFSLDKNRFYFNHCFENWQHKTICNILTSDYTSGTFHTPSDPGSSINKEGYTSSHPTSGGTYNENLEVIYFASDRPGGKGGMDIWFTVYNKKTKTYTEPKNAGTKINTEQDEITPFYNNITKTLYFSSNGNIGMGGFDIFKATGELKKWLPVKNLGYPFNTNADDLYYANNEKQNKGFFVSNREGSYKLANKYCCFDLYYYQYNGLEQITLKGKLEASIDSTLQKYFSKGIVFRNQDSIMDEMNRYYENTIVSLYVQNKEENDSVFIARDTASNIGEYLFNVEKDQDYNLIFRDNEEFKGQIKISTSNDEVLNNSIVVNPLKISIVPEEALIIKNIYYEFNQRALNEKSKTVLDSTLIPLLKEKPGFSIEISSHTDSIGEDKYNLQLSEQRAENVARYLNLNGIEKARLETIGYGDKVPIAPNSNPDGTDNPAGRELNRRTEFRIISTLQKPAIRFK